jgi:transposase
MMEELQGLVQQLQAENRLLREELRLLKHHLFGRSRERLQEHPELFEIEATPAPETPSVIVPSHERKRRAHPGRHEFPEHLLREVVELPLDDAQRLCTQCGNEKARIGVEVTQELEVVPAKLFVREYHREKCACRHCHGEVTTAPAPSRPIEKGIAGPGLLAQVVTDKYVDHMPLHRQEKRWEREGILLPRKTLCGWLEQMYPSVRRIVDAMKVDLFEKGYIQVDEVPVPVRDPTISGRHRTSYLWEYSHPLGPVVFDFKMSRARAGPSKFLEDFEGFLQHDAYEGYENISPKVVHVACMAHIRRKFWEAHKAGDLRAEKVVLAIRRLYRIEREARDRKLDAEARLELRLRKAARRMDLLHQRITRLMNEVLPKSALGKACAYALAEWQKMKRYLDDGRIEIDNNLCENGIRPITLGRKNWLHIGSENAGPWTAAYVSLAETCRRHHINPFEYFRDIFARIADHPVQRIADLTPYRWKQIWDQDAAVNS